MRGLSIFAGSLWLALAVGGCSTLTRIEGSELLYRRVTPEVAFYMMRDSPDALLLDLRPASEVGEPIPELRRARNLPLAELAERAAELEPYRERTFLVYCGGDPECARRGMRTLVENGCVYAVLIDGRLDGWSPPVTEPGAALPEIPTAAPEPAAAPAASYYCFGIGP